MSRVLSIVLALLTALLVGTVLAQEEEAQAEVTESQRFGPYLTDGEGRTLYLFVNEELEGQDPARMTEGVRAAAVTCTGECLEAWPAFTAESEAEIQAGDQLDPELLYTAEFDGRMHVVYNGWPLFYFARDEEPGQINGQAIESFGGEWYIVSPEGQIVRSEEGEPAAAEGEEEGDVAGGGEAEEEEETEDGDAGGGAGDGGAGGGGAGDGGGDGGAGGGGAGGGDGDDY
jgi:predicted lipoprotein with Yx(FWY)xxD motif